MQRSEQYVHEIRTITLDLDDTLWAIHPVIERAEQRLYDWLGENVPRVVEMYRPADMLALREQVILEMAENAHDLSVLRRTVLSRMGVSAG